MKQEKIHWFLIDSADLKVVNNTIHLTTIEFLHQFNRVLKFKQGEKVVLFDGNGNSYKCEIEVLEKRECSLKVLEKNIKHRDENKIINLFFGIPKKDKFELIIEKGTEVGVSSFNPIITDRTEKLNIKKDRAERILVEASEQSQNSIIPQVLDVQKLENVIPNINSNNTFVFHTDGEKLEISDLKFFGEANLLIGPEGGWSHEEIEIFKNKNFKIYKIGDSILKTETACIVIPFLFNIN